MKIPRCGRYIITQLQGGLKYKAFVPSFLPFEIKMDNGLQHLLSKADVALGRLDGIAETLPSVDFFILMHIRKEATLSSKMKGAQASLAEVLQSAAKIKNKKIHKDLDEILNYISKLNHALQRLQGLPLSLRFIKEIHKILSEVVRDEWISPGEFRTSPHWVDGGDTIQTARFIPAPPHQVLPLLDNFEKFLHDTSPSPVLIKAGIMHAQMGNIHPFTNGNGRVGRLLIAFYLYRQGILKQPLLYLSEFFMANRRTYIKTLYAVNKKDDMEGWLRFFLKAVAISSDKTVMTVRKILQLRHQDMQKVMGLGGSAEDGKQLLDFLYKMPLVRVKTVEAITGLKNPNDICASLKDISAHLRFFTTTVKGKRKDRASTWASTPKFFFIASLRISLPFTLRKIKTPK